MASPNNAVSLFDATAVNRPQSAWVIGPHARLTYAQAHLLSCRIAQAILRIRLGRAPRVAVLATNQPVSYAALMGVLRAGGAAISLHWMVESPDVAPAELDCDLLFYSSENARLVRAALAASPRIKLAICLDDADAHGTPLSEWLINVPARDPEMPIALTDPALYTRNLGKAMNACSHRDLRTLTQENIVVSARDETRPVYLSAGLLGPGALQVALVASSLGGTIVALPNAEPRAIVNAVPRYGVTQLFLPRRSLEGVIADAALAGVDLSTIKQVTYRGEAVAPETISRLHEKFGAVVAEAFFYRAPATAAR